MFGAMRKFTVIQKVNVSQGEAFKWQMSSGRNQGPEAALEGSLPDCH